MRIVTFLAFLLVVPGAVCEVEVYVSQKEVESVVEHRLSQQRGDHGGFKQIKGPNNGISYFIGYEKWTASWNCWFNLGLHVLESINGQSWIISKQKSVRGYRYKFTVFVADADCDRLPLTKVFYARCHGNGHDFGRFGLRNNLCGKEKSIEENSFYIWRLGLFCEPLDRTGNAHRAATKFEIGDVVKEYEFSCEYGLNLEGDRIIRCEKGEWKGKEPSCKIVRCPRLKDPPNGRVDNTDNTFDTSVFYKCDEGYELKGGPYRCGKDGNWLKSSKMSCIPKDCGPPPTPNNGYIISGSSETTYGSTVKFGCNDGYAKKGPMEARCTENGQWKPRSRPICEEILCDFLSHPENGETKRGHRKPGAVRSFACHEGYRLKGTAKVTCVRDGDEAHWSGPVPECKLIYCNEPSPPVNGQVFGKDYRFGATVKFKCNPGYRLHGSERSKCMVQGWDTDVPTCKAIVCNDPGIPENGKRLSDNFQYSSEVKFACDPGYILRGESSIVCQEDRTWTSKRPECEAVSCKPVQAPQHGTRDGDAFEYPSKITFSCFPGYQMEGKPETRCKTDGSWSNSVPTCIACPVGYYREPEGGNECKQCPANSNTTTIASTSRQQCSCNPGTRGPQGGPCTDIKCDPLEAPVNGRVLDCSDNQGSECKFVCNPGYYLSKGSAQRRCTAQGWTGTKAKCTACPLNSYKQHAETQTCHPCPVNSVTTGGNRTDSIKDCVCDEGFKGQPGGPCKDIDECAENKGGCNQHCENTKGSYTCSCTIPGYEVDADGKTCIRKKMCKPLQQKPRNGYTFCRYTEGTNGHICFIKCQKGYFFVSGKNNYVTCGSPTEFKWSHRTLNATARIPACTKEFFIDVELPVGLSYNGKDCSSMTNETLLPILNNAVQGVKHCSKQCKVKDVSMMCKEESGKAHYKVEFDIFIPNEEGKKKKVPTATLR